jgi:RHS repeat-associated protein
MNVGGTNAKSQYWFSQDYTETTGGNREHYVRIGDRIVAKVIMKPGSSGAMSPVSLDSSRDDTSRRDGWPPLTLAALLFAIAIAAASASILWKKRGWIPATALPLAFAFTATSCQMVGGRDKVTAAVWHTDAFGDDAPHFFHSGIAPGPIIITKSDGAVIDERRYEPFGQPVDSRAASTTTTGARFDVEPQNILGRLSDPNTGWSYQGARWMAPQTARWAGPDPAVKIPDLAHLENPWSLNPYQYASQSPTLYWDPNGQADTDQGTPSSTYVQPTIGPQDSSRPLITAQDVKDAWNTTSRGLNAIRSSIAGAIAYGISCLFTKDLNKQAAAAELGANVEQIAVGTKLTQEGQKAASPESGSGNAETEAVKRVMSRAELQATKDTGLVRGGRDGTHFATDAVSSDAKRAQERLSLPQRPDVKVTLEVPKGAFSPPSKVKPDYGMPGGGMERTATGPVPARVIKVEPMKGTK